MADNRMKDDDLKRDMGSAGRDKEDYGQRTPGRNPEDQQRTGETGGQQGGRDRNLEDDDMDAGTSNQRGGQNRGGQNR